MPLDSGVAISPTAASATDVVYDATAGKFIAAIRYHGLYSSTNGTSWTRMANQPSPLSATNCPAAVALTCPMYRGQLAVVKGRDEVYFWFVSFDPSGNLIDQGIWQSVNGGPWAQISELGLTNCGDPGNNGCGAEQGFYNLEIAGLVNPVSLATELYAGAVNLFKCELPAGARTCATLDPNLPNQWINLTHVYGCSSIAGVHPDQHGLDFALVGGKALMYFANDGGIYRTLDGLTALKSGSCGSPNGFDNLNASSVAGGTIGPLTQFVSFSMHPTDQDTVLGGTQDNGSPATSTATGSAQWTAANGGDGGYNAIDASTPSLWYTANNFVNIYACANGVNCATDDFTLTVGSGEVGGDVGAFYTPYILDPQNSSEMLVGTCRVWQGQPTVPASPLTAISANFDTLGDGACTGTETNLVSSLAAGGPAPNGYSTTAYATTEGTGPNASPPGGGEVWVTTNVGTSPMAQVAGAINPSNYAISSVALDASDATGATAYVGIMGFNVSHVFRTTNAGGTGQAADWTDWSGSGSTALPDAPVNALLVDSSVSPSLIYAGTDVGLFVSSTATPSWSEVGVPPQPGGTAGYLPSVPVTAIRMFNSGGTKKLRVSTYGRGIWEFALAVAPDYTNQVSNSPQTVYQGQLATFNGTLTTVGGYSSVVNLSCAGNAPTTCAPNPTQATPTAAYTLTAGGTAGDYDFSVHAVGTDPQNIAHDAAVTLHVVDFGLTAPSPNALTVQQGGTSSGSTFQVTASGSFAGVVTLSCPSGLPTGVTCQFSPSSTAMPTATSPVTITLNVGALASAVAGGPNTVTLAANVAGAPAAKTQTFTITVTAPVPDFSLVVTENPATAVVGQDVSWNGTLTARNGYNTTVNLGCTGTAPSTCGVNPSALVPTASGATFTVNLASTTVGTFSFNIQGTDGSLVHWQPSTLTVGTDVTWSDTGVSSSTVTPGQTASYTFSAAPAGAGAFTGVVTFACASLPALSSCSFSPTSIAAGAGTTTITVKIATTAASGAARPNLMASGLRLGSVGVSFPGRKFRTGTAFLLAVCLAIPIAGIFLLRRQGVGGMNRTFTLVAAAWLILLAGCGAVGGGGGGGGGGGTPAGSYSIQVSATAAGGAAHSSVVTLTVN